MTTELWYLFWSALLLSVLWIPYVIGLGKSKGPLQPEEYVKLRETDDLPYWVKRANRAHINLVEQFGAFAAFVVIAHLAKVSTSLTVLAAAVFFWARLAHAIVFLFGLSFLMIRTVIFTVSFLALLVFAWEIVTKAG